MHVVFIILPLALAWFIAPVFSFASLINWLRRRRRGAVVLMPLVLLSCSTPAPAPVFQIPAPVEEEFQPPTLKDGQTWVQVNPLGLCREARHLSAGVQDLPPFNRIEQANERNTPHWWTRRGEEA